MSSRSSVGRGSVVGMDDGYGRRSDDEPTVIRPTEGRRRRGRGWWAKRAGAAVLAVVLLVGGFGTWLYFHASGKIKHENVLLDYPGRPAQGTGANWLLIGTDSRAGLTRQQQDALHTGTSAVAEGSRSDSMMLLHSGANGTSLVSLPRDSYVTIPAWTDIRGKGHAASKNKLNAAYAAGGAPLLIKTVESFSGIRVDHFAEVGFGGFVGVTDAVGGVRLCLDKPLVDQLSGANFKAGCEDMTGAQSLAYVRARYSDPLGDLGRMQRQRQFLAALAHKVSGPGVVFNPFNLVPVLDQSLGVFTVSDGTGLTDLYSLFQDMKSVSGGNGRTIVVPIANPGYNVPGIGSTVQWDAAKADQLWAALRTDQPVPAFPAV